ncbi:MAG: phenylacetate--CoA ligase family protein [Planctomycetaceae bacterium]|nr:phenylacetate--CoA ligase family protein [Planctomycetaceae bacterium]
MLRTTLQDRRRLEQLPREELSRHQLARLNDLLAEVVPHNRFYAEKLAQVELPLASLADLASIPFTFKEELVTAPSAGEFAANLTYPLARYVRYHHTSGTRGRPMPVLDTAEDWQWWIETWQFVLDAAEVGPEDRVFLAFSFGPFIGFWSAHDAAIARGALAIPGGGMSTLARLELIRRTRATVLFCTPSYALRLAETAADNQIDPAGLDIRRIIVAGEPGGSVAALRRRIESVWNARLIDHAGASEIGPWGYGDREGRGLYIAETEFIAEFLSLESGRPATDGQQAELVLTSLGRFGSPIIRYRTGDVVRPRFGASETNRFVLLEGGVLGRTDDMLIVRGVNVFPSSVEQILRAFPEIVEYRVTVHRQNSMDLLAVEVEDRLQQPDRVARELHVRLGLKVDVRCVPLGSLPRFEGKGKRFIDQREDTYQI